MLLIHLIAYIFVAMYGLFGLIPNIPFGLVNKWEIFLIGAMFGIVSGSVQSYSRSVYSQLIPVGRESEFFSLQQITDKGSSWLGPAILAVTSNYVSIRYGLIYVVTFLAIPIPIIYYFLDVEKGRKQAARSKIDLSEQ